MTLRDLLEALHRAPEEALDQQVSVYDDGGKWHGIHIVEAVKVKGLSGIIGPFEIFLVSLDVFKNDDLHEENDRRIYLSKVKRRKGRKPRLE